MQLVGRLHGHGDVHGRVVSRGIRIGHLHWNGVLTVDHFQAWLHGYGAILVNGRPLRSALARSKLRTLSHIGWSRSLRLVALLHGHVRVGRIVPLVVRLPGDGHHGGSAVGGVVLVNDSDGDLVLALLDVQVRVDLDAAILIQRGPLRSTRAQGVFRISSAVRRRSDSAGFGLYNLDRLVGRIVYLGNVTLCDGDLQDGGVLGAIGVSDGDRNIVILWRNLTARV